MRLGEVEIAIYMQVANLVEVGAKLVELDSISTCIRFPWSL